MDKRDEQNEDLAAFALGSLDETAAQRLAAQIESDAELAAELEEWRDVAANLAFIAPAAEPAPAVRENILAAIRKMPQTSNSDEQTAQNGASVATSAIRQTKQIQDARQSPEKARVLDFPAKAKTSFWSFAPVFGAVAASIIAVFLGIALYNTAQSNKAKTEQIAELNQKITDAQKQLERVRQERELLASPATYVKALNGTGEIPGAKARLVFDPKTGQALLYVEGLPAAPQGKAYQIWFISDPKHPAPGKTFGIDQNGKGILRDEIPVQNLKAEIFAVTLEPESGSTAPTTSPVLVSAAVS